MSKILKTPDELTCFSSAYTLASGYQPSPIYLLKATVHAHFKKTNGIKKLKAGYTISTLDQNPLRYTSFIENKTDVLTKHHIKEEDVVEICHIFIDPDVAMPLRIYIMCEALLNAHKTNKKIIFGGSVKSSFVGRMKSILKYILFSESIVIDAQSPKKLTILYGFHKDLFRSMALAIFNEMSMFISKKLTIKPN